MIVSGAIRNHILQWVNEKNRKLSDGYDFEVQFLYLVEGVSNLGMELMQAFFFKQKSRTPAKRAITSSQATDLSQSIGKYIRVRSFFVKFGMANLYL